jgi:hypothetical protein
MGKNTPERQEKIVANLRVEKDVVAELAKGPGLLSGELVGA